MLNLVLLLYYFDNKSRKGFTGGYSAEKHKQQGGGGWRRALTIQPVYTPLCPYTVHTIIRQREKQLDLYGRSLDVSCQPMSLGIDRKESQTENPQQATQIHTHLVQHRGVLFCGLFTLACRLLSLPFLVKMSAHPSLCLSFWLFVSAQVTQDSYGKNKDKQTRTETQIFQGSS